MLKRRWIGVILVSILILDQIAKYFARGPLQASGPLQFLGGWIRLENVENPGAFLSLGAQLSDSSRQMIFQVGVIFILIFTAYLLWKNRWGFWGSLGLTFILAGGIGNLIDRLIKGTVTDFLILGSGWFRTGVINLADVAITAGLVLLLLPDSKAKSKAV